MHINSKYEFGCGVPKDLKFFHFHMWIEVTLTIFTAIDNKCCSGGPKNTRYLDVMRIKFMKVAY